MPCFTDVFTPAKYDSEQFTSFPGCSGCCLFSVAGIAAAGSGIGTFVFAPLTEWLIDRYMWRGTLIITAGILLNIVVCGALFRPFPEKPRRQSSCGGQVPAAPAAATDDDIMSNHHGYKTTDHRQCRSQTCSDSDHSLMTSPALPEVTEMNINREASSFLGNGMTDSCLHGTSATDGDGSTVIWTPLGVCHRCSLNGVVSGKSSCDVIADDNLSLDVAFIANDRSALLPADRCDRLYPARNVRSAVCGLDVHYI